MFLLLSFIAGVFVRSFAALPYIILLFLSVAVGLLAAFGVSKRNKTMIICGFCAVFFVFGVFRFEQAANFSIEPRAFESKSFRGIVHRDSERKASVQELVVAVLSADGEKLKPFIALVTIRKYPEYKLGDEIIFFGTIKRPENFGDFDYAAYLRGKGIIAVSSFPSAEKVGEGKANPIRLVLSRMKYRFEKNIDLLFSEPYGALLKGLLLGERALLSEDFLTSLKITGTTHIVALSGYNITLVGALMLSFLLWLTVPFRAAFWFACVLITLFVLMTGAAASVVRAGIMGILVLVAKNEGRTYHMTNALVFAAGAMIVHNPFILRFDTGFQLSFLATCGILYLPSRIEPYLRRVKESSRVFGRKERVLAQDQEGATFLGRVETIFIETMSAQIFVLPFLIFTFGSISIISPLANALILPAVPYAMGWGFAAAMIGFFFVFLARLVAAIPLFLLFYIIQVIEWLARVPFVSVLVYVFPWYALLTGYGLIIAWIIRTRNINRYGKNTQ